MEPAIFELIINTSGVALALALLFYFSIKSFNIWILERTDTKQELKILQTEFHEFKNKVIEKFILTMSENTDTMQHLREEINKKFI